MNIKIQCCGLALLLVLYYFYRSYKKARLYNEDAFIRVFTATVISVSLDIISVAMIYWERYIPGMILDVVCKMYVVSVVWVTYTTLMYVIWETYDSKEEFEQQMKCHSAVAFVGSLLASSLPIYHYHADGIIYTYGPSVVTTYLFAISFLVTAWYISWKSKDKINYRRWEAIQIWMILWVVMAFIQFFNSEWLLISFGCSLGMVILYLKLENPERNLDRYTGLFNFNTFVHFIQKMFWDEEKNSIVSLIFEHKNNKELQGNGEALLELANYLSEIEDAKAFRYSDDEIILVFSKQEKAEEWISELEVRFQNRFGKTKAIMLNPKWMYFPNIKVVENGNDLLHLLRYARLKWKDYSDDDFLVVDETIVWNMRKEKEIEALVMDAIEYDRVEVFYQPIFSTKEHYFTSAEALVRIRDKDGKIVPPGVFIPVAEQNGMILQIGEIVFKKVCRFLMEQKPERYGIQYIEVNLSVVQCAYENLADVYIGIMEKYGVKPHQINLEITESASLHAKKTLLNNMSIMRNYGISFSLDDFGTGQSNLNYIVDMPVDIVKFDRDMTNVYFENGKAKYVMDAAMHMIHGLELEIVSEGIETEEQYQTMEELGISYIQGYYFSKPLPEDEFLSFISHQKMAG